nr:response regulator [uncultured Desulfobulbus sp.]
MSSIAISCAKFCREKEVLDHLVTATGYSVVRDRDLIEKTAVRFQLDQDKVERALYGPPSVFNKFTLERENILARLKAVLAEELKRADTIYYGAIAVLIPQAVSHVLRVGLFDETKNRLQRAMDEGLVEKKALKIMKKNDVSSGDLAHYLYRKPANDRSLYDIFLPMSTTSVDQAVQIILENDKKAAVLQSAQSLQAVEDMALAAQVECTLLTKGCTNQIQCQGGKVTVYINESVYSFEHTAETLSSLVRSVAGVGEVQVIAGKDYHVSVYRDCAFELPTKVLLVDDEQEFVQTLSDRLNTRNYGSYPVFDGEQAMELLESETPDVMVLDLKMPGMQGVDVLRKTKEVKPEIEVIILTGHGSEEDRKVCLELGAFAYLQKPVDIKELTELIDTAHKKVAESKVCRC